MECGKVLRGRIDKKFCDDYCRNTYNNRRSSDKSKLMRNINNALLKNRRILEAAVKPEEDKGKTTRQRLAQQGFDFVYQTHLYQNQKGQTYHFCYDYGYLPLENDWLLVVRRKA